MSSSDNPARSTSSADSDPVGTGAAAGAGGRPAHGRPGIRSPHGAPPELALPAGLKARCGLTTEKPCRVMAKQAPPRARPTMVTVMDLMKLLPEGLVLAIHGGCRSPGSLQLWNRAHHRWVWCGEGGAVPDQGMEINTS